MRKLSIFFTVISLLCSPIYGATPLTDRKEQVPPEGSASADSVEAGRKITIERYVITSTIIAATITSLLVAAFQGALIYDHVHTHSHNFSH